MTLLEPQALRSVLHGGRVIMNGMDWEEGCPGLYQGTATDFAFKG
jgi:hypothetical protein